MGTAGRTLFLMGKCYSSGGGEKRHSSGSFAWSPQPVKLSKNGQRSHSVCSLQKPRRDSAALIAMASYISSALGSLSFVSLIPLSALLNFITCIARMKSFVFSLCFMFQFPFTLFRQLKTECASIIVSEEDAPFTFFPAPAIFLKRFRTLHDVIHCSTSFL